MRTFHVITLVVVLIMVLASAASGAGPVRVIRIEDVISPATSDFLSQQIERAADAGASCLIVELDTPGGLETAMRDMVKEILNADLPIVVYVSPPGARAASAGVFVTMAAHVAAMAPGTNIGAAHPVNVGGGEIDEEMAKKMVNDSVAFAKTVAQQRGRNMEWAEQAVRESVSAMETEALDLNVIDLICENFAALVDSLEGRTVVVNGDSTVLWVAESEIVRIEMGFRHRVLSLLANPNIAYILLMLGFYGLFFELSNPGAILPGVAGGIAIILAFFAFQMLPVNYAGVLLILFALVLFIAEVKVTSYGLLTVAGIVAMTLGSIMLFESPMPFLRVSWKVILPVVLVTSALFVLAVTMAISVHRRKATTGTEGMLGEVGVASSDINPRGQGRVRGEIWTVWSEEPIRKGDPIEVIEMHRMRAKVRRVIPRAGD
ncbi:MAG: nodulation protein NfeD [Candidatus Eisenbacteria sp.]|nr:nodulation protein NfeD [Candidatus Eisenbacteria bacterium]